MLNLNYKLNCETIRYFYYALPGSGEGICHTKFHEWLAKIEYRDNLGPNPKWGTYPIRYHCKVPILYLELSPKILLAILSSLDEKYIWNTTTTMIGVEIQSGWRNFMFGVHVSPHIPTERLPKKVERALHTAITNMLTREKILEDDSNNLPS